jgi:hypothetical protein
MPAILPQFPPRSKILAQIQQQRRHYRTYRHDHRNTHQAKPGLREQARPCAQRPKRCVFSSGNGFW